MLINNPFIRLIIYSSQLTKYDSFRLIWAQDDHQKSMPFQQKPIIFVIIIKYKHQMNFFQADDNIQVEALLSLLNQESSSPELMPCYSFSGCQYQGVDQYLSKEAFMVNEEKSQVSQNKGSQMRQIQVTSMQSIINSSQMGRKGLQKSLFHNFQKHLLTLLKKTVHLKRRQLLLVPSGGLAIKLWNAFLAISSKTKRILYVAFGVERQENEKNLQFLAQNTPLLQDIMAEHTMKEIEEGQDTLRGTVARQLSHVNHRQIKNQCRMKRFQEFYSYFSSFIDEISKGPPCRRLSKTRKECILEAYFRQNQGII